MSNQKIKKKRKSKGGDQPPRSSQINLKEEVSADFFDYFEDDEPYQEIQIT